MNDLYELHTHLYGCLAEEEIQWLGKRKKPRWEIYINSFENTYGRKPDLSILNAYQIFSNHPLNDTQKKILKKFYVMDSSRQGFLEFQTCFDFIIALSYTDPEELSEISKRVILKQEEAYAEYRMMFSPKLQESEFKEKLIAIVEAFDSLSEKVYPKTATLLISLNREYPLYEWQYEIIKSYHKHSKSLIGIDFAGKEESFPPKEKIQFIRKVLKDNQDSKPLLITYHVGESFTDKTPASAIRWILQVQNVHRISHAVALAYTEERIENKTFIEIKSERKDHLDFLLKLYEKGETWLDIDYIQKAKKELEKQNLPTVKILYEGKEKKLYLNFLEYSIYTLKEKGVIIESCPTSNFKICGFSPLKFFVEKGFNVCIGSDDPCIFQTNLEREFDYAKTLFDSTTVEKLKKNNQKFSAKELLKSILDKNQEVKQTS